MYINVQRTNLVYVFYLQPVSNVVRRATCPASAQQQVEEEAAEVEVRVFLIQLCFAFSFAYYCL
jgi:hypothetical protein